jgi:opacity protein-like surface antigen
MKRTLTCSALTILTIAGIATAQAAPCNTDNHICYLQGNPSRNMPHTNMKKVQGMYDALNLSSPKALAAKQPTPPRPVAVYVGAMAGTNFLHASGTDYLPINAAPQWPDRFVTNSGRTIFQYGGFVGMSFHGKHASWLNVFHPQFSVWSTTNTDIHGKHTTYIGSTPYYDAYQYHINVKALSLNGLFDLIKFHHVQLIAGGGINFGEISTSNFSAKPLDGAPDSKLTAPNHSETKLFYDLKAGLGMQLAPHLQARMMYSYYPSFNYSTGKLKDQAGPWNMAIKSSLSMQTATFNLAYTF